MIPVVKSLSVEGAVGPSADKFLVRKPTQEEAEAAVRTLLKTLNDTDTLYPGTSWKLRYRLVGDPAS